MLEPSIPTGQTGFRRQNSVKLGLSETFILNLRAEILTLGPGLTISSEAIDIILFTKNFCWNNLDHDGMFS